MTSCREDSPSVLTTGLFFLLHTSLNSPSLLIIEEQQKAAPLICVQLLKFHLPSIAMRDVLGYRVVYQIMSYHIIVLKDGGTLASKGIRNVPSIVIDLTIYTQSKSAGSYFRRLALQPARYYLFVLKSTSIVKLNSVRTSCYSLNLIYNFPGSTFNHPNPLICHHNLQGSSCTNLLAPDTFSYT